MLTSKIAFFTIIYQKIAKNKNGKKIDKSKSVFELNYKPENVKKNGKNCFYLSCLGSFLVFKK